MIPPRRTNLAIDLHRAEPWIITAIILLGTAVRVWRLSDLGLIHFDEGVYALSGLWSVTPVGEQQFYPKQILFSPPLFPILVGIAYWIQGQASDSAVVLVNVLIGSTTIALVWWFTRRWFGAAAAISAAALVALSDFHTANSRTGLTDVTFAFLFLSSLASIAVALERRSFVWSILAGFSVGATWNTKYHGWLPLIIALPALLVLAAKGGRDRFATKRPLTCWLIITVVALICYLPWVFFVELHHGGYLALMTYQRKFLSSNWLQNLWQQAEMQWYMDGWMSRVSPAIAYLLAFTITGAERKLTRISLNAAAMILLGCILGGIGVAAVLAVLTVPVLVRHGTYYSWILLFSMAILLILIPFYRPYSRLVMPLVLCVCVAAGVGISWLVTRAAADSASPSFGLGQRVEPLLAIGFALLVVLVPFLGIRPTPRIWVATDSVRRAVATMLGILPKESTVLVHGAPEVAFYFRRAARKVIPIDYPVDHPSVSNQLGLDGGKCYLVTGIYSQREPRSRASLRRFAAQDMAGVFSIEPNEIRLLDDFTPSKALHYRLHPNKEYDLRLYRFDCGSKRGVRK